MNENNFPILADTWKHDASVFYQWGISNRQELFQAIFTVLFTFSFQMSINTYFYACFRVSLSLFLESKK